MKAHWLSKIRIYLGATIFGLVPWNVLAQGETTQSEIEKYLTSLGSDLAFIEATKQSDQEQKRLIALHAQNLMQDRLDKLDGLAEGQRETGYRLVKEMELLGKLLVVTDNEHALESTSRNLFEQNDPRLRETAFSLAQALDTDAGYNQIYSYGSKVISSLPKNLDQESIPDGGIKLSDLIKCFEKLLSANSVTAQRYADRLFNDFRALHEGSSKGQSAILIFEQLHRKLSPTETEVVSLPPEENSQVNPKPKKKDLTTPNPSARVKSTSAWLFVIVGTILLAVIAVVGFKVLGKSS